MSKWMGRKIAIVLCAIMLLNPLTPIGSLKAHGEGLSDSERFVRMPFNGDVVNIGTSEVVPDVVGELEAYATGYESQALQFDTDYAAVGPDQPAPYVDLGSHTDLNFGADVDYTIDEHR